MPDLLEHADIQEWDELQRKAAVAPHGLKRKRERQVREFATELLRKEVEQGRPT